MEAKVQAYKYIAGSSRLIQGVKGGKTPDNAVAGGCGTFITREPAKVLVTMEDGEGNVFKKDIYPSLRKVYHADGKKVTEKRAEKACHNLLGKIVRVDDKSRDIEDIEAYIN